MEKQGHTIYHDHEVSAVSGTNRDDMNNVEIQSSEILTVSNSPEKNHASRSFSNENAFSTVVVDEISKEGNISKQPSDDVASKEYAISDVSSDTGSHLNMESGVKAGAINGKGINAGEFCQRVTLARKPMAKSLCSNSTLYVPFVSSSNDSFREISTEAKSSEFHTGVSSITSLTDYGCSIEEPVKSCDVSVMGAQITQKAVYNIRARGSMKVSEAIRIQTPVFVEENSSISCLQKQRITEHALGIPRKGTRIAAENFSIYNRAPNSSSFGKERNLHAINDAAFHFPSSHKLSCLTETKEEVQPCDTKDEGGDVCSRHIEDHEVSIENADSTVERRPLELTNASIYQLHCEPHGEKISESATESAEDFARKELTSHAYGFDLNEDIYNNDFDCRKQLVCKTGSSCSVIYVVAQSGVPPGIPIPPLRFEGAQGWKGSAPTSAFRPTLSKSCDRKPYVSKNDHGSLHSEGFMGINLNVAPEEDNAPLQKHGARETSAPYLFQDDSLKINSTQAKRLCIDLNCLSDTTDECLRASLPVTSRVPMVDFNLNEDPLTNTNSDVQRQWRNNQHMENTSLASSANSFQESSRDRDLSFARPICWTDLSTVQFFGHSEARPLLSSAPNVLQPVEEMQRIIPQQPRQPYILQTLPSHSYPSGGPFFIGPGESLCSGIQYPSSLPYVGDPQLRTVFPRVMNQSMLPSFSGTPQLMQEIHVRTPTEVTSSDVVNRESFEVNENMRDNTRRYLPLTKTSIMEEQVKPFHLAALHPNQSMKRREPDVRWKSWQPGNRQFT